LVDKKLNGLPTLIMISIAELGELQMMDNRQLVKQSGARNPLEAQSSRMNAKWKKWIDVMDASWYIR